jgi:hypothetical protein
MPRSEVRWALRTDGTYETNETNGTNETESISPVGPISRIRSRSSGFHNVHTLIGPHRRPSSSRILAPSSSAEHKARRHHFSLLTPGAASL